MGIEARCVDFVGGGTGHLHENVQHGDNDLRLLLARRLQDGERPEEKSGNNCQRSKLRLNEDMSDAPRQPQSAAGIAGRG